MLLYRARQKESHTLTYKLLLKIQHDAPKDALFYLAKTNHVNYKFDEAIKLYTEYKKIGSSVIH
jgi:hypothetical protein